MAIVHESQPFVAGCSNRLSLVVYLAPAWQLAGSRTSCDDAWLLVELWLIACAWMELVGLDEPRPQTAAIGNCAQTLTKPCATFRNSSIACRVNLNGLSRFQVLTISIWSAASGSDATVGVPPIWSVDRTKSDVHPFLGIHLAHNSCAL